MFRKKLHVGHYGLAHIFLPRILYLYKFPPKAHFFYSKNCIRDSMVWRILSFQGSYINVHLILIYFLVLKNSLKNCIRDSMVWPFFRALFSVSKVFKKFESWAIWFNLYCHLEKIDQFLLKAHTANSDQDKIWIQPYCPFMDSTSISIKSSWNIEIFLKKI